MCKWTRPFWGTDCRRATKSLSLAQPASRKCLQGKHFVRCCHSTHGLLFRGSWGVTRRGQQQFATQTLRVHFARYRDNRKESLRTSEPKTAVLCGSSGELPPSMPNPFHSIRAMLVHWCTKVSLAYARLLPE